jgi:hypothetical protein
VVVVVDAVTLVADVDNAGNLFSLATLEVGLPIC